MGSQKPNGLILDTEEKITYITEGARCSHIDEVMETAEVSKIYKYRAPREEPAIPPAMPGIPSEVEEFHNMDIVKHRWRCNTTLGIERRRQHKILRPAGAGPRVYRVCSECYEQRKQAAKGRRGPASLGHRGQRWQLGPPVSLSSRTRSLQRHLRSLVRFWVWVWDWVHFSPPTSGFWVPT